MVSCNIYHSFSFIYFSPPVSKKRQPKQDVGYDETPQEKKLRLAKLYLEQLKDEGKVGHSFDVVRTRWVKG